MARITVGFDPAAELSLELSFRKLLELAPHVFQHRSGQCIVETKLKELSAFYIEVR
jgi:hypothetical protein